MNEKNIFQYLMHLWLNIPQQTLSGLVSDICYKRSKFTLGTAWYGWRRRCQKTVALISEEHKIKAEDVLVIQGI